MQITTLKAGLYQACVTHIGLNGEDSFAIDGNLLDLAGIHEYEQIHVYNARSGERLISYAVRAEHGSRTVAANGAAAHKTQVGDRLTICAYVALNRQEVPGFKPVLVYCNEHNHVFGAANTVSRWMAA